MKLYAHECCECGNAIGYSFTPIHLADAMCNDCASAFVRMSAAMGMKVNDEDGDLITPSTIVNAKWQNTENYEYHVRSNIKMCQRR